MMTLLEPMKRARRFPTQALVDVFGQTGLFDLAQVHHRYHIGGGHRFRLVIGDVDGRVAILVVQPAHLEAHFLPQIGVDSTKRLIQQQRLGLHDQGARQRDALLLAARRFAGMTVSERTEMRGGQDCRQLALDRIAMELSQFVVGHVLSNHHPAPEHVALKDHRHVAPLRRRGPRRRGHQLVAHANFAGRRLDEARDQAQRRRLAGAQRGAEQAHRPP